MEFKCLFSHCFISRYIQLSTQTWNSNLFKESWNTTSDLKMGKNHIFINNNLFSFSKVSNISIIINPSWIISSPCLFVWSSWNYVKGQTWIWWQDGCVGIDISLNDRLRPLLQNLWILYPSDFFVPDELFIKLLLLFRRFPNLVIKVWHMKIVMIWIIVVALIKKFWNFPICFFTFAQYFLCLTWNDNWNPVQFFYFINGYSF